MCTYSCPTEGPCVPAAAPTRGHVYLQLPHGGAMCTYSCPTEGPCVPTAAPTRGHVYLRRPLRGAMCTYSCPTEGPCVPTAARRRHAFGECGHLSNKCLLGSDKYRSTLLAMTSQEVPQHKKQQKRRCLLCDQTNDDPMTDIKLTRYNILKLHYHDVSTNRPRAHVQAYMLLLVCVIVYACIHPMFGAHWHGHSAM